MVTSGENHRQGAADVGMEMASQHSFRFRKWFFKGCAAHQGSQLKLFGNSLWVNAIVEGNRNRSAVTETSRT